MSSLCLKITIITEKILIIHFSAVNPYEFTKRHHIVYLNANYIYKAKIYTDTCYFKPEFFKNLFMCKLPFLDHISFITIYIFVKFSLKIKFEEFFIPTKY